MFCENKWKVFLLVAGTLVAALDNPRSIAIHRRPYKSHTKPMFIQRSFKKSQVLFLDDEERKQSYGVGEIDLTLDGQIKFDQGSDYDFTSPDVENDESINARLYDPKLRGSTFNHGSISNYYQGRFGRPYTPNHYGFEPHVNLGAPFAPVVRNGFYSNQGWKARSPRVVFPYPQENAGNALNFHTNSHGGPSGSFNDNVVFREQNFGISDVPNDDLALQDIGTGNADNFNERDANAPHRARNEKFKKRMDFNEKHEKFNPHYIPLQKNLRNIKPMFIQTESTKILPPSINFHEYTNITRDIGGRNTVLPKFKPISDDQILKISEILKELPIYSTTPYNFDLITRMPYTTTKKGRKGKNIANNAIESSKIDTVTEKITITTKGIQRLDEKSCPQGGTCEFFFYCWMVGGLLEGTCGVLLKGCCHRVAKAGILGVQDSNSIDSSEGTLSYGPVINDQSCGIAVSKQTAQRRIVGGDDAGFGTFPWQAYIRIGSSRCNMLMSIFELIGWKQCWIERCGGSLISRRHVVTAGHCVARAQPRHVRVTLGDYVINSAAEPLPAYTFGVRTIKVHPLFKFTPQADRFDVAVLTLDRNVHYMPHIAPICLPERGSDFLGQYGWAAGWGALSPGSRLRPRTLQAVDVPVLDNRVCERWHRANGINVVIYPEMLCAGYRGGGKDSCQGDSGGPLMLERTGRWYLIGVVSAGYSCASRGQPGIYHRVAHTVDWISHATTLS